MRGFVLGLAALGAVAVSPALAQRHCQSQTDLSSFEIQALRAEMTVLATGCGEDQRYNAFVRRFQTDLQANENAILAYFKRTHGRGAQTAQDRFVTDMTNGRSRVGIQLGSDFCPRNSRIFSEVMALRDSSELAAFAAAKDLVPPSVPVCQEMAKAAPTPAPVRVARK